MNPKNCLVEFIGTFFLVLVVGLTVVAPAAGVHVPGADHMAPLAIGFALMVIVAGGGHISGGHYNPAVTLGVFLRGKCAFADVIPYIISQCVAGICAGLVVNYFKGTVLPPTIPAPPDLIKAMLNEFLFTFLLVSTVLNTATSKKNAGNSYYPLAIGFAVVVGAYAGRRNFRGAYNPAVACGNYHPWASALSRTSGSSGSPISRRHSRRPRLPHHEPGRDLK